MAAGREAASTAFRCAPPRRPPRAHPWSGSCWRKADAPGSRRPRRSHEPPRRSGTARSSPSARARPPPATMAANVLVRLAQLLGPAVDLHPPHRRVDEAVERHHREDGAAGPHEVGVDADHRRPQIVRREIGIDQGDAVAVPHVAQNRQRVAARAADRSRSASTPRRSLPRKPSRPRPAEPAISRSARVLAPPPVRRLRAEPPHRDRDRTRNSRCPYGTDAARPLLSQRAGPLSRTRPAALAARTETA